MLLLIAFLSGSSVCRCSESVECFHHCLGGFEENLKPCLVQMSVAVCFATILLAFFRRERKRLFAVVKGRC